MKKLTKEQMKSVMGGGCSTAADCSNAPTSPVQEPVGQICGDWSKACRSGKCTWSRVCV